MGKSIAVLDDQQFLADSLARRFARRGFETFPVQSVSQFQSCLAERNIDLCICDIELDAECSGIDLLAQLKSQGSPVPFIFLTGHGEESEIAQKALSAGAVAVFGKPMDFSLLLVKVCEVLGVEADTRV